MGRKSTANLSRSETYGVLAQLVERLNGIEEVRGSNPLGSTTLKHLGGGGWDGFDDHWKWHCAKNSVLKAFLCFFCEETEFRKFESPA